MGDVWLRCVSGGRGFFEYLRLIMSLSLLSARFETMRWDAR
jgi:hypothetical protein